MHQVLSCSKFVRFVVALQLILGVLVANQSLAAEELPNIVLVMADDMGWGQTGYQNHPCLKTPNIDAMARNGLRFNRFYAGAPVCSPTRASVLTGRSNMRTGVDSHGYALRLQEKTIAQALSRKGYATGHFGKWHLNGLRGPGIPILASDDYNPGNFGFGTWVSVSNFFDQNPVMSRMGKFEEFEGDSSEVTMNEAVKFIEQQHREGKPSFTVVWFGTPHSPWKALQKDAALFEDLDQNSKNHYGELVAMDRSIGQLRSKLQELNITENTLVWFCSDNGGLNHIKPDTVGGLRGFKGTVYEGGLRVPCVMEWPTHILEDRVTNYPAATMDIFPTVADIVGLPKSDMVQPQDGLSLTPLFEKDLSERGKPLGFSCLGNSALIDESHKILLLGRGKKIPTIEYYDLSTDPHEKKNLYSEDNPESQKMKRKLDRWLASVEKSIAGKDYPEGKLDPPTPEPRQWMDVEELQPYFPEWEKRWEYWSRLNKKSN